MVDGSLRSELSQDIRRLATGRMTTDEFDDRYYDVYNWSDDRAVNEIAAFGYGLYSSGVFPNRLRGRYALDATTKTTIVRSVLFLRCSHEYGWPPIPYNLVRHILAGVSYNLGFPGGVAMTLIGFLMAVFDPEPFAYILFAIGLPIATVCLYVGLFRPVISSDEWDKYTGSGDYECWPFLLKETFENARKKNFLLGH